tara:strand:- start:238 stop:708 length:471 start_codon:yes stop_codon:yes gene_type:complete
MAKKKIQIIDYLDILQREWVQFFWAYNSFPRKYREKYLELFKDREIKIIDISSKILVSNIFSDMDVLENKFKEVFTGLGEPKFNYRGDDVKGKIHHFNIFYFFVGEEVKCINTDTKILVKEVSPTLDFLIGDSKIDINNVSYDFNFKIFKQWLKKF